MLLDVSKLWAMTLTQYDRVAVVDADVLFLEPIDDIWDKSGDYMLTATHDWSVVCEGATHDRLTSAVIGVTVAATKRVVSCRVIK